MTRKSRLNPTATTYDVATALVSALAGTLETSYVDDPVWAVVDSNGHIALGVKADGSVRVYKLDLASITDGTIETVKLSATVQSQLVAAGIGTMLTVTTEASGYLWAVTDSAGRIALGVKTDGTVAGKFAPTSAAPTVLPEISGSTPSRKLWTLNHTTGVRTLVTASGDPRDAVEDNGAILFTDDTGRRAYTGGLIVPAYPDRTVVSCWGDSLTKDCGIPEWLDANLAATVANKGASGQTADEIAIRQGGYTLQLSVSGGSIPTSGGVTVTTAQSFVLSTAAFSQAGSLAGVPGTLSRADGSSTWTFTRTTGGSAVAVAGATPFTSDDATTYQSSLVIIAAGRNDHNVMDVNTHASVVAASVVAAHDAMVARLRTYHVEYLILGTCTPTDGVKGTYHYLRLRAINDALAARFGNRFCSYQNYLATQCITDLGITPNGSDTTAMAGDTMPPSITINAGHFSVAAGQKVAENVVKPKLDQLGWTL